MTSSARLLPHALPSRLCSHNLLDSMRVFAQSELEMGTIRSVVPQQVDLLKAVCNAVVDRSDGVSIWAAVLLVHMPSDPRTRRMIAASRVLDMEAATANLFQNYARAEVTRRAHRHAEAGPAQKEEEEAVGQGGQAAEQDGEEEGEEEASDDNASEDEDEDAPSGARACPPRARTTTPTWPVTSSYLMKAMAATSVQEPAPPDVEMKTEDALSSPASTASTASVASTSDLVARRASRRTSTPSRKRKRLPSSSVARERRLPRLLGGRRCRPSTPTSCGSRITQSEDMANPAAMETLSGQMPRGFHAARNALLVDISSRNACSRRHALEPRAHQAARAAGGRLARATCAAKAAPLPRGARASRSDAIHTSIHVRDRAGRVPAGGARNDHVCLVEPRGAQHHAHRRDDQPAAGRRRERGADGRGQERPQVPVAVPPHARARGDRAAAGSASRPTARSTSS